MHFQSVHTAIVFFCIRVVRRARTGRSPIHPSRSSGTINGVAEKPAVSTTMGSPARSTSAGKI